MNDDPKRTDLEEKKAQLASAKAENPVNQITVDKAQKAVDTAQAAI